MSPVTINTSAVAGVALASVANAMKMLMLKRSREGYWSHVSGTIEDAETAPQAIVREFREETGVVVVALYSADYIDQFYVIDKSCIMVVPVFVAMLEPEARISLNEEHVAYQWCSLPEAKSLAEFPNQRSMYDHVWHNFVEHEPSPLMRVSLR